jgi:hypothetical protein
MDKETTSSPSGTAADADKIERPERSDALLVEANTLTAQFRTRRLCRRLTGQLHFQVQQIEARLLDHVERDFL